MSATIDLIEPTLDHDAVDAAAPSAPTPPTTAKPPSRIAAAARSVAWGAVGFAVLIGLWAAAAAWKPQIPTPAATFTAMRQLLEDPFHDGLGNDKGIGVLLVDSLGRVFKGFAFAVLVGVPLGLLMGASRRAWMSFNPVIQLLRPVSPLAWFPIWLTMFRDAPQAAVWTIFLTALWPIVLNTATGAASVPIDQRNVAQVFRFSRLSYLRHVLVPHSLPSVVTGLRLSMGIAWMVIVAIEMLSGGVGIGFFVWDSYNALNLAKVICAIGIIGTVGLVFDAAFPPTREGGLADMTMKIDGVWKSFTHKGSTQHVLRGVDLTIDPGTFVSLTGQSGCGKSTLINLLGGLTTPDAGTITLDGEPVGRPGPDRAMVFQNYSLLPRLSLVDNVRVAVRSARPEQAKERADEVTERYLTAVGLWDAKDKKPNQVSGGMQQRTAVARGFAVEPRVLLLDEPFGALDAFTRARLQKQLVELWRSESDTEIVVMVTHGIDEAALLSDRIVVMGPPPQASVLDIVPVDIPRPRDRVRDAQALETIQARLHGLLDAVREPEEQELVA